MSDTLYNARTYIKFSTDEFIAMIATSLVVAIALSLRDLLFAHFGEPKYIESTAFVFVLVLFIVLISVWLCKLVAVRTGHIIEYRAHYLGLISGLIITALSFGYLPLFLPGGFVFSQPERLGMGKWRGQYKTWEVGLVSGTFPLAVLLFVLVASPAYIFTHAGAYLTIMTACCLIAIYACIPLPFLQTSSGTNATFEWYRHMKGTTFGLDVIYESKAWYVTLACTIILFSLLTYLLTVFDVTTGFFIYLLSLAVCGIVFYVYPKFFK